MTPASEDNQNPPQTGEASSTQRIAKQIIRANLINLGKRIREGKTLTAGELALVKEAIAEAGTESSVGANGWADTQVELAEVLGVDRRTVTNWLKEPGNPGARANGKYNVNEWREWAEKNGKKLGDPPPNKAALQARNLILQNERLEFNLAVLRREYVATVDVERWVGAMVMQSKKVLLGAASALAPQLSGLTVPEIEERLRESFNEALVQLHSDPLGAGFERKHGTEMGEDPE